MSLPFPERPLPAEVRWGHGFETEEFAAFDLANQIVRFFPDGSPGGYRRAVAPNNRIINTDPVGDLALADDDFVEVPFPPPFEFPFFGERNQKSVRRVLQRMET